MSERCPILSTLISALQPDKPHHPKLLQRAILQGRTRSVAVGLIAEVLANPTRTATITRNTLRSARFLHSNERRLIGDAIADIFRLESLFRELICRDSDLPPADYYWSAWLLLNGVDPSLVRPDDIAGQLATIQHQEEPENLVTALARAPFDPDGRDTRTVPPVRRVHARLIPSAKPTSAHRRSRKPTYFVT